MGNDSEFVVRNRTMCQSGSDGMLRGVQLRTGRCTAKAKPGSMYCQAHLQAALARVAVGRVKR